MEIIIIGTSYLWIWNTHHYKHTQYCYIPDGVHCSDGLRSSDGLRKGNKHFFKIRRSYNSCKMKHIIVRLTQIRLKKCWQCVHTCMLKLKSESKSSVGSLLYNSAVGIVTF